MNDKKLGLGKMMCRYVVSAAGVALIVLLVNVCIGAVLFLRLSGSRPGIFQSEIGRIADGLDVRGDRYAFDAEAEALYRRWYIWAMLLDGEGAVVWSQDLPGEIPLRYSAADIAHFTRWFLKDYPVTVWRYGDRGLLVLGSERGSIAKYNLDYPARILDGILWWTPALLVLNMCVSVLLAMFLGYRMFRSIRPVAAAISDLSEQKPVELPSGGLLGGLSHMLNQTSGELQRQRAMLEKRDRTRAEWIAGISHDIRTPLSMVMGYAGQLEDDRALAEKHRKQATVIRAQSQRIKELIANLNLASRLEYGWQPLEKKPVALAPLLRAAAADALNSAQDGRHTITALIDDSAAGAYIVGDAFLLRRAVQNLLDNSIRHNETGCNIAISMHNDRKNAVLTIEDDGCGISEEMMEKMKIPSFADCGAQGHGMGLSIALQIVKAHGGEISFEGRIPSGLKAKVALPLTSICQPSARAEH